MTYINEMIDRIKVLVEEMENLTLDASVGAKRYKALGEKLDKKRPDTLKRTLNFLEQVRVNEYEEVVRIWTLPTMNEDVWFNYLNLFGDTTFDEVRLLKKARKNLKIVYVSFFKETRKKTTKVKVDA